MINQIQQGAKNESLSLFLNAAHFKNTLCNTEDYLQKNDHFPTSCPFYPPTPGSGPFKIPKEGEKKKKP